jgi:hypothetical protein
VADQLSTDLADVRALDDEVGRELTLQRRTYVMCVRRPEILIRVNSPDRYRIERALQTRECGL